MHLNENNFILWTSLDICSQTKGFFYGKDGENN